MCQPLVGIISGFMGLVFLLYPLSVSSQNVNDDDTVNVGFTMTGGNSDSITLNSAFHFEWGGDANQWTLEGRAIYGIDSERRSADQQALSIHYQRRWTSGWGLTLENRWFRDELAGIYLRVFVGPGVRFEHHPKSSFKNVYQAGLALTHERQPYRNRKTFATGWGQVSFQQTLQKSVILVETLRAEWNLQQMDDYVLEGALDVRIRVNTHLSLVTGFRFRYDHVPAVEFGPWDLVGTTSLQFLF